MQRWPAALTDPAMHAEHCVRPEFASPQPAASTHSKPEGHSNGLLHVVRASLTTFGSMHSVQTPNAENVDPLQSAHPVALVTFTTNPVGPRPSGHRSQRILLSSKRSSSQIEHAPWPVDEYRPAGQLTHVSVCCCSARYLPGSHAPHAYDCVDCQPRIGSPLTSVGPTFPTGQKRHCSPPIVPMEYAGQESVTHKHGDAIH